MPLRFISHENSLNPNHTSRYYLEIHNDLKHIKISYINKNISCKLFEKFFTSLLKHLVLSYLFIKTAKGHEDDRFIDIWLKRETWRPSATVTAIIKFDETIYSNGRSFSSHQITTGGL